MRYMPAKELESLRLVRNVLGVCLIALTLISLTNFLFEITGKLLIPMKSYQILPVLSALLIVFIIVNKLVTK